MARQFDRVRPEVGDTIAIVVGEAWEGKSGVSGFYYGLEAQPDDASLPGQPGGDDDGALF